MVFRKGDSVGVSFNPLGVFKHCHSLFEKCHRVWFLAPSTTTSEHRDEYTAHDLAPSAPNPGF